MPLYNSRRDSGFLKGINRELLHGIISIEVGIYKLDLSQSDVNIYEESEQRAYRPPVRVFCQMRIDTTSAIGDEYGIDYNKTGAFGFLKADLRDKDLYIEGGDIIFYDDKYWEIDQISKSNYWSGRNPNKMIGTLEDNWPIHGYDHYVVAEAHITRTNSLHIVDKREGRTPSVLDTNNSIPKFL